MKSVPSRERIHIPTKREKENHRLKSTFGRGYVSSLEGKYSTVSHPITFLKDQLRPDLIGPLQLSEQDNVL